jgi:integrase
MAKRRGNGEGSIWRTPDGAGWKGEVSLDGKRYVRRGKTRAEVVDRLNALRREHATGELSRDQSVTVAQVVDRYVDRTVPNRKGGRLSPTALARYRWAADHLNAQIGSKRAARLSTTDVERMLDRLDLSRDSMTKILNLLRAALDAAVRRGEIARNVATVAELPGVVKPERTRQSLSIEAARNLLAGLNDERNGALFACQMLLALRPGEAAGLFWEDLDLDAGIVNVTRGRQIDERGRVEIVDDLKTRAAKRTLEMPPALVDMLARHRKRQAEERLAAGTWVDSRLVFATTVGTPLNPTSVRRDLTRICQSLDVLVDDPAGPRPPLPYELRHTGASVLSAAGVPHETIADLMGLTSPRMIESRYRHRLHPTISVARQVDWNAASNG